MIDERELNSLRDELRRLKEDVKRLEKIDGAVEWCISVGADIRFRCDGGKVTAEISLVDCDKQRIEVGATVKLDNDGSPGGPTKFADIVGVAQEAFRTLAGVPF